MPFSAIDRHLRTQYGIDGAVVGALEQVNETNKVTDLQTCKPSWVFESMNQFFMLVLDKT